MLDFDTIKPQRFDWAHQLDKAGVGGTLGGLNMASFKLCVKTEQQNPRPSWVFAGGRGPGRGCLKTGDRVFEIAL